VNRYFHWLDSPLGETSGQEITGPAGKIGKDLDGLSVKPAEMPKAPTHRLGPAGPKPAEAGGGRYRLPRVRPRVVVGVWPVTTSPSWSISPRR